MSYEKNTIISSQPSPIGLPKLPNGSTMPYVPQQELEKLMANIESNILYLSTNKTFIQPEKYHSLLNYHGYILNIFNDMKMAQTPRGQSTRDIYAGTKFPNAPCPWSSPSCPWESQFDEMVKNPTLNNLPSNNVWASPPWK